MDHPTKQAGHSLRFLASELRHCIILVSFVLFSSSQLLGAGSKAGLPPEIVRFIAANEAEARTLAKKLNLKVSPDVWAYLQTAQTGSIASITNAFERLKQGASQYEGSHDDPAVATPVFQAAIEVELAVDAFAQGDPKYSMDFGKGVINSIPPGSIYFGGTDPGRGLITALCKSHTKADPFFTITQNALADGRYLEYIRELYGAKIQIPTTNDSLNTFQEFLTDAQKRLEHDRKFPNEPRQLRPGEDVRIVDNRVQVSGQVAVMAINGLLAKIIFERNPEREFYIEESFPLDWMNAHLSPHGLIMKLNRKPLVELSDQIVRKDRDFWMAWQHETIGDWLTPETSIKDLCSFALSVYGRKDFSEFKGDRGYIENAYVNKLYSKLRSSVAGIYAWRLTAASSEEERKRMAAAADFAFRQAFAFCPRSPEAIFRYVSYLISLGRVDDASRIALSAATLDPGNSQYEVLIQEIEKIKSRTKK
jgi:hypothetical protein